MRGKIWLLSLLGLLLVQGCGGGSPRLAQNVVYFDGRASAVELRSAPDGSMVHAVWPQGGGVAIVASRAGTGAPTQLWRWNGSAYAALGSTTRNFVAIVDGGSAFLTHEGSVVYRVQGGVETPVSGVPGTVWRTVCSNASGDTLALEPVGGGEVVVVRAGVAAPIPGSALMEPRLVSADGSKFVLHKDGVPRIWDGAAFTSLPLPAGVTEARVLGGLPDFSVLCGEGITGTPDSEKTIVWTNGAVDSTQEPGGVLFVSNDRRIRFGYMYEQTTWATVWGPDRQPQRIIDLVRPYVSAGVPAMSHHTVLGISPDGREVAINSDGTSGPWLFRLP